MQGTNALHWKLFIKRLLFSLGIFSVCRILFLVFFWTEFNNNGFVEIAKALVLGLRFDIFASFYLNVPLFFAVYIPFRFQINRPFQFIQKGIFVIGHLIVLVLNLSDIVYYKFSGRRIAYDFISFLKMGDEGEKVAMDFILQNWYLSVLFIILSIFLVVKYPTISFDKRLTKTGSYLRQFIISILLLVPFLLGIRGGWQYKPIKIINAGQLTKQEMVPLVLNNPFCIISTWKKTELQGREYFSPENLSKYVDHEKVIDQSDSTIEKPNIVLLIMESFSREYIGYYNGKGYTPFLDSLLEESLVFDQAFANGTRSIESLPSILASIPALSTEAFITSFYGGNRLKALPHYLNEMGYSTAFFHGGATGTMGFDGFCAASGIQRYIGKEDYPNPEHDDGKWGIYDDKFFPFFLDRMNKEEKPFFYTMFSLSSHHPYRIPKEYQNRFPKGELKIHESIGYADEVLRQFFDKAKQQDWFDNTTFIITADHSFRSISDYYKTTIGKYRVPLAIYNPKDDQMKGKSNRVVQQIDIMPTVLDVVGNEDKFVAFGNSVFAPEKDAYAINYINEFYQYLKKDTLYQFDGSNLVGVFNYRLDSLLRDNLIEENSVGNSLNADTLKAIIQDYEARLINNNLLPEPIR